MSHQEYWLQIKDRDGWQRKQPLEKRIIFIGSHPGNDVCLASDRGSGVAPKHIQLILNQTGYKLVNISDENVILHTPGVQLIPPHGSANLVDGYSIQVGEFNLTLQVGKTGVTSSNPTLAMPVTADNPPDASLIGLQVVLSHTRLSPFTRLNGIVIVRNLGEESGVKIELELRGIDAHCYHLDSGPLLSSGAEQEVHFYVKHLGHLPPAGPLKFEIEAVAAAYPTALPAVVSQTIEVLPCYNHQLTLRDPDTSSSQPLPSSSNAPPAETIEPAPQPPPIKTVPSPPRPQNVARSQAPEMPHHRPDREDKIKPPSQVKPAPDLSTKEVSTVQRSPSPDPTGIGHHNVSGEQPPTANSSPPNKSTEATAPVPPDPEVPEHFSAEAEPERESPAVRPAAAAEELAEPLSKLEAEPGKADQPLAGSESSNQEAWWLVEEEPLVIEKQAIVKIQSKAGPSSAVDDDEPSPLVEDWIAEDEE